MPVPTPPREEIEPPAARARARAGFGAPVPRARAAGGAERATKEERASGRARESVSERAAESAALENDERGLRAPRRLAGACGGVAWRPDGACGGERVTVEARRRRGRAAAARLRRARVMVASRRACGALEQRVLATLQALDELGHEVELALVGLEREVDRDATQLVHQPLRHPRPPASQRTRRAWPVGVTTCARSMRRIGFVVPPRCLCVCRAWRQKEARPPPVCIHVRMKPYATESSRRHQCLTTIRDP